MKSSNRDWQHRTIILAIWEAEARDSRLAHRVSSSPICVWEGTECRRVLACFVCERPWGLRLNSGEEDRDHIST